MMRGSLITEGGGLHVFKDEKIEWSPRLAKADLLRLYQSDADGLPDEELLEDVGLTLYLRCSDILYVYDLQRGIIKCPSCRTTRDTDSLMRLVGQYHKDNRDNL
jgi:hypothetical protein